MSAGRIAPVVIKRIKVLISQGPGCVFKGHSSLPSLVTSLKWSSGDEAYQCGWQNGVSAPRLQLSPGSQEPLPQEKRESATRTSPLEEGAPEATRGR